MIATRETIDKVFPGKTEFISNRQVNKITNAVFQLLRDTGVKFDKHERAYRLLQKAGCKISSDGIVKFPIKVIEENLFNVPEIFRWWDRTGSKYIEYGSGKTFFIADCKAPNYIDPFTGQTKPSDQEGVKLLTKLADALPEIDICGTPITTNDFLQDNLNTILNTTKPLILLSGEDSKILKATIELGTALRGSRENLKNKPFFATIISPEILHFPKFAIDEIELCTEYNIPIFMAEMAVGGISSPVTIPGTLVLCMASTLSGIILTQLFKKGHPCNETSFPTFMDPATMGIGGFPENTMADMIRHEICTRLNIPFSQQTALVSRNSSFNQDCVAEINWNLGALTASKFDAFWGAGTMKAGLIYSPHSLVYANDLAAMQRKVWKGVDIDDNGLGLDVINKVKNGMYITEDHTIANIRKHLWMGKYSSHQNNDSEKDLFKRIEENTIKLLDKHNNEMLSVEKIKLLKEIAEKYKKDIRV